MNNPNEWPIAPTSEHCQNALENLEREMDKTIGLRK